LKLIEPGERDGVPSPRRPTSRASGDCVIVIVPLSLASTPLVKSGTVEGATLVALRFWWPAQLLMTGAGVSVTVNVAGQLVELPGGSIRTVSVTVSADADESAQVCVSPE